MIKRIIISLTLCASLLPAFAGRVRAQRDTRDMQRDEFHQTYKLSPDGRVTLHNINGSVHIEGWERDEVRVDAVKSAYTRTRLDEARIEVNNDGNSVEIRTRYPSDSLSWNSEAPRKYDNPASVEYTISVPHGARLQNIELINGALDLTGLGGDVHASSINGKVTVRDLSGEAKLSTINGPLEVTLSRLDATKPVSLGSVNGLVTLILPSDANAGVKASTVHGTITNDFGLPVKRGRWVGSSLDGQLGTGGPRIRLDNVNGMIHVRHASDGRSINQVTNLLTSTQDDADGPSEGEIQRQVAREVEQAMRDAERAGADAQRAGDEARREAEQARREATRERAQELREATVERERALRDAERERVETQRESERERLEAQREAERARADALREQQDAQREAAQTRREAQREAELARRDAERERVRAQREAERARQEIDRDQVITNDYYRLVERETKTFPAQGSPRVRVETFDGAVAIEAWDRPEVQYTAVKRARDEQSMRAIRLRTGPAATKSRSWPSSIKHRTARGTIRARPSRSKCVCRAIAISTSTRATGACTCPASAGRSICTRATARLT